MSRKEYTNASLDAETIDDLAKIANIELKPMGVRITNPTVIKFLIQFYKNAKGIK